MKISLLILVCVFVYNSWAGQKLETLFVDEQAIAMVLDQSGQPVYSQNCLNKNKKCHAFRSLQEVQLREDDRRLRGFTKGSLACEQVGGKVVRAVDKGHHELGLCQFEDASYMDLAIFHQRVLALENLETKKWK